MKLNIFASKDHDGVSNTSNALCEFCPLRGILWFLNRAPGLFRQRIVDYLLFHLDNTSTFSIYKGVPMTRLVSRRSFVQFGSALAAGIVLQG